MPNSSPSVHHHEPDPALNGGLRERNKAEKWRRIREAASHLFATRGFEATTTAAIAEEAGIGTGTLYLYVTSKEDLLVAVFREDVGDLWEQAFEAVDATAPVIDQLTSVFTLVIEYHDQDPELACIYFKELLFVSPATRDGVITFMRSVLDRLTALLEQAKLGGRLRTDVPSAVLARNLFAQFHMLAQRRYGGAIAPVQLPELLAESFRVTLWALTPE